MPNPIHYQVYGHGAPSLIFFVSAFARSSPGTLAVPGIAPWRQQIRNQAVIGGNYSGFSAMGLQPWRLLANQIGPSLTPHRNLVGEDAEINGGTGQLVHVDVSQSGARRGLCSRRPRSASSWRVGRGGADQRDHRARDRSADYAIRP